jgi:colicin import membrane protein
VQSAIDLKVWKELAISKQLLIKTATDALGLDPECKEEELKLALVDGVQKIVKAESLVQTSNEANKVAMLEIQMQLKQSEKGRKIEEGKYSDMAARKDSLEKLLEETRKLGVEELKSITEQLEKRNKELKSIKVALADTPENVVKKMKALNKKKHDETTARKRSEDETRVLRKEKQELKDKVEKLDKTIEEAAKLAASHRELQAFSEDQFTLLKDFSKDLPEDSDELKTVPKLDEELLKQFESSDDNADDETEKKGKKKKSKK